MHYPSTQVTLKSKPPGTHLPPDTRAPDMYKYEANLVEDFLIQLTKPENLFGVDDFAVEFNYQNGRTDIIGKSNDGEIIAFEAKLEKWQKALNQAFRNTSFSHYSYVLLPEKAAMRARKYADEFKRRSVGLCSFHNSKVCIEISASKNKPLQPWLTETAFSYISMEPDADKSV